MSGSLVQTPTVSIVIPTHNRRRMLPEAVESCLKQTFTDSEILIVDDGSTDGTDAMVADQLKASWAPGRVRYVRQDNRGASSARNRGLRIARGRYVQFLDSDDLLDASKIFKQLETLESEQGRNASCCLCLGRMASGADASRTGGGLTIGVRANSARELLRELCTRRVHGMQTAAPLWRRDFLTDRPGWREDIGLGDDLEYHARLLVDVRELRFVDDELFFVREHGGDRLSVFRPTVSSVSSLVKARRSVHESAQRAGVWDEDTQKAFLVAMRTIYANALETGSPDLVADLERWLWDLASRPNRRLGVQSMICARRAFGRHILLRTHRIVRRLRII